MWDILLAAAVGAVVSAVGWALRASWETRRSVSKSRRQFVADVLDSQVIKDVDYFTEPSFDFRVFYRATQVLPVPPTLLDIELDGELSTARQLISDQLRDLYDLRVAETRAGRVFSPKLDAELLAFRRRLIAWARGRGRVHDIYRMLP